MHSPDNQDTNAVDPEVDLDDLEPLSDVAERNRKTLDELEEKWPDIAFQRPLSNGEL